jgi:hypothetical protein
MKIAPAMVSSIGAAVVMVPPDAKAFEKEAYPVFTALESQKMIASAPLAFASFARPLSVFPYQLGISLPSTM